MEVKTLSTQEVFDKVCNHLMSQGEKAETEETEMGSKDCMYRLVKGDKVLMCAAGCLISDEEYTPDLENKRVNFDEVSTALIRSGVSAGDIDFLTCLQTVHDWEEVEDWPAQLQLLAENHNLTLPESVKEKLADTPS